MMPVKNVRHSSIGCCAVPVFNFGRTPDIVAGSHDMSDIVSGTYEAFTRDDQQTLSCRMRMPERAGSRFESDDRDAVVAVLIGAGNGILTNFAREDFCRTDNGGFVAGMLNDVTGRKSTLSGKQTGKDGKKNCGFEHDWLPPSEKMRIGKNVIHMLGTASFGGISAFFRSCSATFQKCCRAARVCRTRLLSSFQLFQMKYFYDHTGAFDFDRGRRGGNR